MCKKCTKFQDDHETVGNEILNAIGNFRQALDSIDRRLLAIQQRVDRIEKSLKSRSAN